MRRRRVVHWKLAALEYLWIVLVLPASLDSVFVATISYTIAKRAINDWLEMMPSDRIMWGTDQVTAEGVYGATESPRRCLAEVLAEKVILGDLREQEARHFGREILRDNALSLFPQLKDRLGKHQLNAPQPSDTGSH
jgi:hypothetical protein